MSVLVVGNALPATPPTGKCVVGAFYNQNDAAGWHTDSNIPTSNYWSTFIPDNGTFSAAISEANSLQTTTLHIAWSFPGTIDLAHIATGTDDTYIRARAQELAQYGKPVWVRLNWEMQGDWYTYTAWDGSGTPKTGNTPADFVNAWRHTVDLVRPIAPNASFVWCPHLWAPVHNSPSYTVTDWYPGDSYVDWCAVTAYPGSSNWQYMKEDTAWGLDVAYAHAVAHGKPFMIAEWGIGQGTGDDPIWINQLLDWVEAAPACKVIMYFSLDNTPRNGVDYRLFNWPVSRGVFRARVTNNGRYITT